MRHIITRPRRRQFTLAAGAALALALGASPALGVNLLQNPGAEASPGTSDGSSTGAPPGWTVTDGSVAVVAYGASGGFPGTEVSTRIGGGANFFGGAVNSVARMNQVVDVSAQGASIDAGRASATISGLLGGFAGQSDNATATAVFLGSAGNELGRAGIGPVSAADRNNSTDLLARSASAKVPAGTRSIRVEVVLTRAEGSYDDGYVDNLSLDLVEAADDGADGALDARPEGTGVFDQRRPDRINVHTAYGAANHVSLGPPLLTRAQVGRSRFGLQVVLDRAGAVVIGGTGQFTFRRSAQSPPNAGSFTAQIRVVRATRLRWGPQGNEWVRLWMDVRVGSSTARGACAPGTTGKLYLDMGSRRVSGRQVDVIRLTMGRACRRATMTWTDAGSAAVSLANVRIILERHG